MKLPRRKQKDQGKEATHRFGALPDEVEPLIHKRSEGELPFNPDGTRNERCRDADYEDQGE